MDCSLALENHLDDICRITDEGKARLKQLGLDQWQKGYPNRETWEEDIRLGRAVVALDQGRVAGAYAFLTQPEEDYDVIRGAWLTGDRRDYASVHRFCVSDELRGRGVAGAMFADAVRRARALRLPSVRVDTHPGNLPMQRAITKAGFAFCGEIRLVRGAEAGDPRLAYEHLA